MTRCVLKASIICLIGWSAATARAEDANCLVRITFDPSSLPLSYDTVEALAETSGVVRAAAREFEPAFRDLRDSGLEFSDIVTITFTPVGHEAKPGASPVAPTRNVLLGRLCVGVERDVSLAEEIAEKLLARICARLEAILAETSEADRERLEQRLALAREEAERAAQRLTELQKLQQSLCTEAGQFDLVRELILDKIRSWEREQQSLDMKLAAHKARQKAVSEQLARVAREVTKTAAEDPVLAELEKVVKLREPATEHAKALAAKGAASQADVSQAEEILALARADVARQRQVASQAAGGKLLGELNQDLMTVAIDLAETEARLLFVRTQLTEIRSRKLLELADRYERDVAMQLPVAREAFQEAIERQQELEQQLRSYQPPSVTILGGTNAE